MENKKNIKNAPVINFKNKMNKRGSILNKVIVQIILIVFILGMFLWVTADRINNRGVRQQVLEKEIALLVDSAVSGMSFEIYKLNVNGIVNNIEAKNGNIFVSVDGLSSLKGYSYFSKYDVSVIEEPNKFVVKVE